MDRDRVVQDLRAVKEADKAAENRLLALAAKPATAALVLASLLEQARGKPRAKSFNALEARCRVTLELPRKLVLEHRTNLAKLAQKLYDDDEFEASEAVRHYDLLLHPDDPEREVELAATISYGVEDHARAVELLEGSVKRFPRDADVHHLSGLILALRLRQFAKPISS